MFFGIGIELSCALILYKRILVSFLVDQGFVSDFGLLMYGLFGMPVFMGFLGYLMVRYQAFNVKVLAVQALVIGLAILIGSQLFVKFSNKLCVDITHVSFLDSFRKHAYSLGEE